MLTTVKAKLFATNLGRNINLRMLRCNRPQLRWVLRLALAATWCVSAETKILADEPLTAAQFNDRFAFLTDLEVGQDTSKATCPEHFWPVPFVMDEVVHRLEIASPDK